jgi:hypothetical protein
VIDVEQTHGVPPRAIADGVAAWVAEVAASHGRPIVYTTSAFWLTLPGAGIEDAADLWIARWSTNAPAVIGGWKHWAFWQHTDRGAVSGIAGRVDLDRFNGSLDDLHVYVTRSSEGDAAVVPAFDLRSFAGVQQALNYLGAHPRLDVDASKDREAERRCRRFREHTGW